MVGVHVDSVELTGGLIDLGTLTEFAALAAFGAAQVHALTAPRGNTLHDLVDRSGASLYPAYYWTHFRVPPARLLSRFRIWEHVDFACHLACYGGMILDSIYCLGSRDELGKLSEREDVLARAENAPSMSAGGLLVIDGRRDGDDVLGLPRADLMAHVPKLKIPPSSMNKFEEIGRASCRERV